MSVSDATNRPLRVLRVLTRPNVGGPTRQAIALWHAMAGSGDASTLLVVGACGEDEAAVDLAAAGIPRRELASATFDAPGFCVLPALGRSPSALGDLRALLALRRLVRRVRPDVVHTHTSKAGVLGRLAVLGATPRPLRVHTWHGHVLRDHLPRAGERIAWGVERALAPAADLHLAVSRTVAEDLARFGVLGRRQAEVVPPAVEVGAFVAAGATASRAAASRRAPRIAFVGRLAEVKRPLRFLDVLARVRSLVPEVCAVVCGDGPLAADVARRVAEDPTLAGAVELCGALEPDGLARTVAACDVVVTTSRREGMPLGLLEALAAGVPVVGFAAPGVDELLTEAGMPCVVETGDRDDDDRRLARCVVEELGRAPEELGRASDWRTRVEQIVRRCEPAAVAAALVSSYRRGRSALGLD
jgi:glycosyltransferase involved in cell wall biosynthesis